MGYQAKAYTVFGIKLKKQLLTALDKERACSHPMNDNDNFCSKCGLTKFKTERYDLIESMDSSSGRLSYFYSDSDSEESLDDDVILGFSLNKKTDCLDYFIVSEPTEDMRQEITDFLLTHNISVNDQANIYSFIYHSY